MAIESLFGVSPESLQAQRAAEQRQQAMQFAQLSPGQASQFMAYQAGSGLGSALGGMMGAKDPELEKAAQVKSLIEGVDFEDTSSVMNAVTALNKAGFTREAMSLLPRVDKLNEAQAGREAKTEELKMRFEAKKEEIRLQSEAKTEQLKAQTQAALERAREQNASREMIAALMADARRQAAQIAADARTQTAQLTAALKGKSPAELKADEKAADRTEGQQRLEYGLEALRGTIESLDKEGGLTSPTKGTPSNLMTYAASTAAGQALGRAVGTQAQTYRDQVASGRRLLLQDIAKATGLSATQLNSNVELQTMLDSLGSAGMSKEANLAILKEIENKFLKGGKVSPPSKEQPSLEPATGGWGIRLKK